MNTIKNFFIKPVVLALLVLIMGNRLAAQDKISPKLRLSYTKHMDGAYEIKGRAYTKKGKQIEPCDGAVIGFYTDADHQKLFKKLVADEKGQAVLVITANDISSFTDAKGHYNFYGRVEEDSRFNSEEGDMSAMNAAIDMQFTKENDTTRLLKATLACYNDTTQKMAPGVKMPLKFFVKRALCLLPVGKELNYTDDQGNAEVTFPNDIPGDKDGNVTIIAKLDEDDNYGTVQYEKTVNWGVPVSNAENPLAHGALIGSRNNAPWFMVIVINAILIGIWGYLCYIIYGLYRINKLGSGNPPLA